MEQILLSAAVFMVTVLYTAHRHSSTHTHTHTHLSPGHEPHGESVPHTVLMTGEGSHTLQVLLVDGLVTDGTLAPFLVTQGEVVEDARPAVHMATPGYLS